MMKKKVNNMKRDQDRRMVNIKKKVNESWTKSQNPNMFGGCPVVDNTQKLSMWRSQLLDLLLNFSRVKRFRLDSCRVQ